MNQLLTETQINEIIAEYELKNAEIVETITDGFFVQGTDSSGMYIFKRVYTQSLDSQISAWNKLNACVSIYDYVGSLVTIVKGKIFYEFNSSGRFGSRAAGTAEVTALAILAMGELK